MTISLPFLFEMIGRADSERDLRSHFAPKVGEYFAAKRSGVFFFDNLHLANRNLQKILDVALSTEHNPVARYVAERHAPAHEGMVTSPRAWAMICPRADHWHVMAGPIVSEGKLVGAVGCTRDRAMPAFDAQNLADLSAVCLHLSVWTATTRQVQSVVVKPSNLLPGNRPLTARELQIANLVASGKTNAEIGSELWITENSVKQALKRMFRKLKVSSRTEMVGQLLKQAADPSAL